MLKFKVAEDAPDGKITVNFKDSYEFYDDNIDPVDMSVTPCELTIGSGSTTVSYKVTFKVANGTWNDGKTDDVQVTVTGPEGSVTLENATIPTPAEPGEGFTVGSWSPAEPTAATMISENTDFTYTYAAKTPVSYDVTFKAVNGTFDNGKTEVVVPVSGYAEDNGVFLKDGDIPAAGSNPASNAYTKGAWDEPAPSTTTAITGPTTYTYSYAAKTQVSYEVTFSVSGGTWNNGSSEAVKATVSGYEGEEVTLGNTAVPAAGSYPDNDHKAEGSWTPSEPTAATVITDDNKSFTYTYTEKGTISVDVTFKAVNGTFDNGKTEIVVPVSGKEGEDLKLTEDHIKAAAVGNKPNEGFMTGSWDKQPLVGTVVTENSKSFTYTYAAKTAVSYEVTFKAVNGTFDGTAAEKKVTATGYQEDGGAFLKDGDIPAAGDYPESEAYKPGAWNEPAPSTSTAITGPMTYTYTYAEKTAVSYIVTFKAVNGTFDDDKTEESVTLNGYEGDHLKLSADQIPVAGNKPQDNSYKAGSWNTVPSTDTEITENTDYIYTYDMKNALSYNVTFKAVNGTFDDDETEKSFTMSGYEEDGVTLDGSMIPTAGNKPNNGYMAGSWNTVPTAGTAITENTTYIYTYTVDSSVFFSATVIVEGNGQATADPATANAGAKVNLISTPDEGFRLKEWQLISGDGVLDGDTYTIGSSDFTVKAVFEEIKTLDMKVNVLIYKNDGSYGLPDDVQEQTLTMTLQLKKAGTVAAEAKDIKLTVFPGMEPRIPTEAYFEPAPEDFSVDNYSVEVTGLPQTVYGSTGQKYTLSTKTSVSGDTILIYFEWDNGYNPEVVVVYDLPEDEIGAYALLNDGTKEYLVFHTYSICMNWLGNKEMCEGYERCFHKGYPYEYDHGTKIGYAR